MFETSQFTYQELSNLSKLNFSESTFNVKKKSLYFNYNFLLFLLGSAINENFY